MVGWGRHKACSYGVGFVILGDNNDAMDMVGHDGGRVQLDRRKSIGQCVPLGYQHLPSGVQAHIAVYYLTEQTRAILRNDRDKIRPNL